MPGFYELKANDKGEFWFVLKADNNEIILRSEQYTTRAMAEKGIAAVRKACCTSDRFVLHDSKDGTCYFNLKADNEEIVGTSETYSTVAARENGIASVKANGASENVVKVG